MKLSQSASLCAPPKPVHCRAANFKYFTQQKSVVFLSRSYKVEKKVAAREKRDCELKCIRFSSIYKLFISCLFASCEKQTPTKVQCKLVRCREGNVLISPTSDRQMQAQNSFPPMSDNLLWMLLINLRLNEIIQMTGRNFLITIYMPKVAEKEKKAIAKGSKKKLNKSRTATLRNKIK